MRSNKPDAGQVFHALGDATRRAILEKLSAGPLSVSRVAESFDVSLAAVVQHLQALEGCGLVKTEKLGRVRTCRIHAAGLEAAGKWIEDRRPIWERQLDRLGDLLASPEDE